MLLRQKCLGTVVVLLGIGIGPVIEVQVGQLQEGLGFLLDVSGAHAGAGHQVFDGHGILALL